MHKDGTLQPFCSCRLCNNLFISISGQRINNLTDLLPEKILSLSRKQAEAEFNLLSTTRQAMTTLMTPWEKRQDLMMLSTNFRELVRSMPVEELFWTIKATGPGDSMPIISACTFEQLQFIFDLDWWDRDNFRLDRIISWLLLLFEAGEETVDSWYGAIMQKDPYLIPAAMRHYLKVEKRPDDMEIEEAKDLLPPFSIDNIYYIAFTNDRMLTLWERIIMKLLELSPGFYRDCMETILTETRMECTETAWKLRCGRMADLGIPDYFSALDIYAPLPPENIRKFDGFGAALPETADNQMPAFVPTLYISDFPALSQALGNLSDTQHISRIIREWTGAANKIIMADRIDLDEPEAMKQALAKSAAMINLGIEVINKTEKNTSFETILQESIIEDLVRISVWMLQNLKKKGRRLAGMVEIHLIPQEYYDGFLAIMGRFPQRWDPAGNKSMPFSSISQVHLATEMLDELESWMKIMSYIKPHWNRWKEAIAWENTNFLSYAEFNWQHGLATAIANFILEDSAVIAPVAASRLGELRDRLTSKSLKEISERIAVEGIEITGPGPDRVTRILDKAVKPVITELMNMEKNKKNDGRFISTFLVETRKYSTEKN